MSTPVQLPQPVNPVVSIQPVVGALSQNAAGNTPSPLANLAQGTLVEGFVINRDTQNNPIVRTAVGDLKVTSDVFLKTGSEVVFRVDTSHAGLARILTVDGLTPDVYHAQNSSTALARDTISTTGLQSPQQAIASGIKPGGTLAQAPLLQAVVLQVQSGAMTATAQKSSFMPPMLSASMNPSIAQFAGLQSGTTLRMTLLDLKLPPLPVALAALPASNKLDPLMPSPTPASPTATPQSPPTSTQASTAATGSTSPLANTTPLPTSPVAAAPHDMPELMPLQLALEQHEQVREATNFAKASRLFHAADVPHEAPSPATPAQPGKPAHAAPASPQASLPNTPQAAPAQASPQGPIVTASIIGHDAEGANILHTSFASLKLYTSQPLPTGTTLVVQVHTDPSAAATPPASPATPQPASPIAPPPSETAMEDIFSWLTTHQPESARELRDRLPGPNSKLTHDLLFFMAALKGGDIGTLLGNRITRQLELQAPALLSRARQQLSAMKDIFSSPADTPIWMSMLVPFVQGQEIHAMKFYLQHESGKEASGTKESKGQRFVVEVNLSALGAMQLDGFVRQHEGRKNFDLMVRTEKPLETEISSAIRSIFEEALSATRLAGQVVFQTGGHHFFRPAENAPARAAPTGPEHQGFSVEA